MGNGSLMKVELLQNAHLGIGNQFLVFFLSGPLKQALLYLSRDKQISIMCMFKETFTCPNGQTMQKRLSLAVSVLISSAYLF